MIHQEGMDWINVEFKGQRIIEIHLRSGNDHQRDMDIGDVAYPVWEGHELNAEQIASRGFEFRPNFHQEGFRYDAAGHLKHVRLGYYIERKK